MIMNICFFFLFFAMLYVCYQSKVFLNLLLVFELLTLMLYSMTLFLSGVGFSVGGLHICLIMLCFGVTETVMGLAILISCSRHTGKTKMTSFSVLKF